MSFKCRTCGESDSSKKYADQRRFPSRCIQCAKDQRKKWRNRETAKLSARKWRANNPDRQKGHNLKSRLKREFGLSPECVERHYQEQKALCGLCFQPIDRPTRTNRVKNRVSSLDHCHVSGKFRGIVHQRCNTLLGLADDSVLILELAKAYLLRHS